MSGVIESKFNRYAENAGKEPAQYLAELIEGGVTQSALAARLDCTRQAVGRIAKKFDLRFPGCEIDIDELAQQVWGCTVKQYVKAHPSISYREMADALDVSISTFKRRVRQLGIKRRS